MPTASCPRSWRGSRAPIRASSFPSCASRRPTSSSRSGAGSSTSRSSPMTTQGPLGSGAARAAAVGRLGQPRGASRRTILPLALGRPTCLWRRTACDVLDQMNRDYRILFTSWSATVIIAAVLSGLAVSVLPECALRPGMRMLGESDGFGALPDCRIGILRGHIQPAADRRRAGAAYLRKPRQHLGGAAGRRGERDISTSPASPMRGKRGQARCCRAGRAG